MITRRFMINKRNVYGLRFDRVMVNLAFLASTIFSYSQINLWIETLWDISEKEGQELKGRSVKNLEC